MWQSRLMAACGLALAGGLGASGCATPTLVGLTAPNFTLKDLAGNDVSLKSFRGMPVLLAFWAAG